MIECSKEYYEKALCRKCVNALICDDDYFIAVDCLIDRSTPNRLYIEKRTGEDVHTRHIITSCSHFIHNGDDIE